MDDEEIEQWWRDREREAWPAGGHAQLRNERLRVVQVRLCDRCGEEYRGKRCPTCGECGGCQ